MSYHVGHASAAGHYLHASSSVTAMAIRAAPIFYQGPTMGDPAKLKGAASQAGLLLYGPLASLSALGSCD